MTVIREDGPGWCLSGTRVSIDGIEAICVGFNEAEGWADIPRSTDSGKFEKNPLDRGAVLVDRLYGVIRSLE